MYSVGCKSAPSIIQNPNTYAKESKLLRIDDLSGWWPLVGLLDECVLPGETRTIGMPTLDQKGLAALLERIGQRAVALSITSRMELPSMVSTRWATVCEIEVAPASEDASPPQRIILRGLARVQLLEVRGRQSPYEAKLKAADADNDTEKTREEFNQLLSAAALLLLGLAAGDQPERPDWTEHIDSVWATLMRALGDNQAALSSLDKSPPQALKELALRSAKQTEARAAMIELESLLQQTRTDNKDGQGLDKSMRQRLWAQVVSIQRRLDVYDPLVSEDGEDELVVLQRKLSQNGLSKEARLLVKRQLKLLQSMRKDHHDYPSFLGQLQFIARLPWQLEPPAPEPSITQLQEILDADHTGLTDVKRRILEYMAVRRLGGDAASTVLCLAGPPGVGKTSLAKSIARALSRPLAHVALGGVHDESELRGHRLSFVAAAPGRILDAIARAGSRRAVMLLDEIDKLGGHRDRSPAAALLEVLDPEQHERFRDNYLGLGFDLSSVFFIATANDISTIPGPLRDRLEIIELDGYTIHEKSHIARSHLLPKLAKEHGQGVEINLHDDALMSVIENYTREAGVRQLRRSLASLYRAQALAVATQTPESPQSTGIYTNSESLIKPLGAPRFRTPAKRATLPVGVSVGLGVIAGSGSLLWIEIARLPGQNRLHLTGQMGEVMKESAHTVHALVRRNAIRLGAPASALLDDLHIHIPEAATPKDGPSAGIALWAAMLSAYLDRPLRADIAMTGELSLTGDVWPVGGIKPKLLAAERAGLREAILPADNKADAPLNTSLTLHWVSSCEDILPILFPSIT